MRRRTQIGVMLGVSAVALVMVAAMGADIITYTYECEVCGQYWKEESTSVWGLTVWRQNGIHIATNHPPTYHGGGYSRWSGGLQGCGVHRKVSP
jgi:hypothetical protein